MWRILNRLKLRAVCDGPGAVAPAPPARSPPDDVLRCSSTGGLLVSLAAFGGLATESMTRGQGWRFLDMGRRLERSVHTLSLLRSTLATVATGSEGPLLEAVLEIADSSMTYRRRYLSSCRPRRCSTCSWPTKPTRARWPSSWSPWPTT